MARPTSEAAATSTEVVPGQWFKVRAPLTRRLRLLLAVMSFVLPIALWSAVSYVPFIWHPDILISDPGEVDYFLPGMRVDKATFSHELDNARAQHSALPAGQPCNPVYLPSPGA